MKQLVFMISGISNIFESGFKWIAGPKPKLNYNAKKSPYS